VYPKYANIPVMQIARKVAMVERLFVSIFYSLPFMFFMSLKKMRKKDHKPIIFLEII
jgi:hypothetical protein